VRWEVHTSPSTKIKKELYSQEQLIKESFLSVIGQRGLLMRLVAKTIQLLAFGVKKDAIDL
jgi:hypothetical protein